MEDHHKAAVTPWPRRIGALTLFVEDLSAAREFHASVFGLTPVFEDAQSAAFSFGNVVINLLAATAAPELIEPAVVAPPGVGARFQITVDVDDVDIVCSELVRRGVRLLNGPMDRPWGVRTAAFEDASGHVWEVATPIRR